MLKNLLPKIRLDGRQSDGLKFRAPESAVARFDKSIQAKAADITEIAILGDIGSEDWGGVGAKTIREALKAAGRGPIRVIINSPGGDAFEGIAMYNLLREHAGRVTVDVIGVAASAASIIAMAGDTVRMGHAATLMIHSAWGIAAGNETDLREFAELLNMLDNEIAAVYAARSGQPVDEILALMKKETWLTAKDAVELGLADVILADEKKSAKAKTPVIPQAALGNLRTMGAVSLSANRAGASAISLSHTPKDTDMKPITERIKEVENKRAANVAAQKKLMDDADAAGVTLDAAQAESYETLKLEIQAMDEHLVRLKEQEKLDIQSAKDVADAGKGTGTTGAAARSPALSLARADANVEKGIHFARMVQALAQAKGNRSEAAHLFAQNQRWMDQSPHVHRVLNTAVPAADTTTSGWASQIAYAENLEGEFIEYLRPLTILGRMTAVRRVPFNVRMGSLDAGLSGYWVGQGKPIPVSKGTTGSLTLGITKAAGIGAFDKELMKISSPSVEAMIRDDLAKAVAQTIDVAFIDPNNGGIANEKPASMLYNVTPITPTGTNAAALMADLASLFAAAIAANLDPTSGVLVMTPTTALKLSLMLTSLGGKQFPSMSINGGTLEGLPVIVSQNALISGSPQFGQMIVLLLQNEILMADDGGVSIEISDQTALEMLDNPTNQSTGSTAATSMVSMYQTESVAVKAVRYINWVKRRSTAAAFIQAANYG